MGGPLNLSTDGPKEQFNYNRMNGISPPSEPSFTKTKWSPLHEAYAQFSSLTRALGTRPATIMTQYLCSVPVSKSKTSVGLLVIVADYIRLLAIWAIFKLFADRYFERKELKGMESATYVQVTRAERFEDGMGPKPKCSVSIRSVRTYGKAQN